MAARFSRRVLELVRAHPGMTKRQLSKALFGTKSYPQNTGRECDDLLSRGLVRISGRGSIRSPRIYSPVEQGGADFGSAF